jgi:rfaE bifunctional protein kinase chain/domain
MAEPAPFPNSDRLLSLVSALAGRPVLMVVDLVADVFVTGAPKRLSREAPILILSYQGERLVPGGGANAVANVAALGGRPLPLGVVGDDAYGRQLVESLRGAGIPVQGIVTRPGYRTPTKVRIVGALKNGSNQQIVRYDIEEKRALSAEERTRFQTALRAWGSAGASVAVLSDYGYGAVDPSLMPAVRNALDGRGTIVGDSRYRLADLAGLDGATPNEEEAEALIGQPIEDNPASVAAAGRRLLMDLNLRFLLVTRGSRGMSLFEKSLGFHLPVSGTDQVADVTGAGDTVIGTFALALAAGATPIEAALLANYAGGVVVGKMGTATLTRDELSRAILRDRRPLDEMQWARF